MEEIWKNSAIIAKRNVDSNQLPIAVPLIEYKQIIDVHSCIVLNQLPDENLGVTVDGFNEVFDVEDITSKSFKVDYDNGVLYFDPYNTGKKLSISYSGIGYTLLSASRIITKYDKWGNVLETLEELIDKAKLYIKAIESLGGAVEVIDKLDVDIESGLDLHDTLTDDIRIGTEVKDELVEKTNIANETINTLIDKTNKGNETVTQLTESTTTAIQKKTELDQSIGTATETDTILNNTNNTAVQTNLTLERTMAEAKDDIDKINATGNKSLVIGGSNFLNNEYTWTHNMNSDNLHITIEDADTNEPLLEDYKRVDKNNILVRNSAEHPNVRVILSASYYQGNALFGTNIEEFASDSVGVNEKSVRLKNENGDYENPVTNSNSVFMEDGTTKLSSTIDNINMKVEEIKNNIDDLATNHLNINIRDLGAKCDGITDDTNALKEAITLAKENNGKSTIDLTYGTILVSENLIIPPLVVIKGKGIYKTTIKAKSGSKITKVLDLTSSGLYNNEFYDFTIDGNNLTNIYGIDFTDSTNSVNDENSKFGNMLIVNCTHSLVVGGSNRGNKFSNINIEHCVNGVVNNGTDNNFTNITVSSTSGCGFTINGSNNWFNMCKAFYCNKEGFILNGNSNNLNVEAQENGLSGIIIKGFTNRINFTSDTNGRLTSSHNIEIEGYKNLIYGLCLFNSGLSGNILTHIKIKNDCVLNNINIMCHGNKDWINENLISASNNLIVNNIKFITNLVESGNTVEPAGGGQTHELIDYTFNKPWFVNYNKANGSGCKYKKEIQINSISGLKQFSLYVKGIIRGGTLKAKVEFYNSSTLLTTFTTESLNSNLSNDNFTQVFNNIPTTATKCVVCCELVGGSDGYSESVILDYGYTMF